MKIKYLAAGIALMMTAVTAMAQMPKEINITYVKSPFNLQNIVIKKQGLLEKAFAKDGVKINWHTINSGSQQGLAMASGDLDISSVMNTASLLMNAGAGNPIKVATSVAHPTEIFAIVGKPGNKLSIKDLKGKTVVGPKGTVLHQMLVAALVKEGMTIKDVKFINMGLSQSLTALMSGSADAALLAANLIIKAQANGSKVVTTAKGVVKPHLVMTVRTQFAQKYPEALQKVIDVNRQTLTWIHENYEEAIAIGATEQGISVENGKKLAKWSNFSNFISEDDIKGLEEDQQFLLDNKMMDKKVDVRALVLPEAYEKEDLIPEKNAMSRPYSI